MTTVSSNSVLSLPSGNMYALTKNSTENQKLCTVEIFNIQVSVPPFSLLLYDGEGATYIRLFFGSYVPHVAHSRGIFPNNFKN